MIRKIGGAAGSPRSSLHSRTCPASTTRSATTPPVLDQLRSTLREIRLTVFGKIGEMGILFVTLSGHGHVTPTLAVVEELVKRGAEVEYATGAEHAEAVTGAGARWV